MIGQMFSSAITATDFKPDSILGFLALQEELRRRNRRELERRRAVGAAYQALIELHKPK
jgi:hypothetical protein